METILFFVFFVIVFMGVLFCSKLLCSLSLKPLSFLFRASFAKDKKERVGRKYSSAGFDSRWGGISPEGWQVAIKQVVDSMCYLAKKT